MNSGEVKIAVNTEERSALRRIWRYVGYDEPNYTYTERGRELLGKLGAMSDSPYFTRCHFMLATGDGTGKPKWGSTNAYTLDADGNPVYSFDIVDQILDAQLAAGCVPFLEIGFMPKALSTAPADVPYEGIRDAGWAYPPNDYSRWADLIREFARHLLDRYGLKQVSGWYWELWNEPDIFYWEGTPEEYNRLYDFTEFALHSVIPQAIFGGPGVTGPHDPKAGAFLEQFLEHCVRGENAATGETGTRIDLLTFHAKGGGYKVDHNAPKETPTMQRLLDHIVTGLDIIAKFPELKGLEVNLSECDPDGWAAGGRHDNPNLQFRNTEYYSSYVANTACQLIDLKIDGPNQVDGMLTWAFQFEDREYFEGLRTLSTNGIDKPVLNIFRMLARLGGLRVHADVTGGGDPATGNVSTIAATDELGGAQVFVSHHHDDWDVEESRAITLTVHGLVPGRTYSLTRWLVDRATSNSFRAWEAMGSPQKLSSEQEQQLETAAALTAVAGDDQKADKDGVITLDFSLATLGATLVELVPKV